MVIAKTRLRALAEKRIHFLGMEKYVTVDCYIAATRRYMSLTPAATLPFTFPFQDCIQGPLKTHSGSLVGSEKIACPERSWCDSQICIFPEF
jgi:hypothetical protein